MDPTDMREVTPKRGLYDCGHEIIYEVEVRKLLDLNSWVFEKTYKTECDNIPTSWDLRLKFLAIREDGTASLLVTLARTDSVDICLETTVIVQISNFRKSLIFPKQQFERIYVLPSHVMQEQVELSSLPDMKAAIKGYAVVRIVVDICNCHTDTDM